MLTQPIRPFEFTSPVVDVIKYRLLSIKPISTIIFAVPFLRSRLTFRQINERILEIPFVLSKVSGCVLDVGSNESPISLMLASMGHKVTALDLRVSSFNHLNINNIRADITKWSKPNCFDTVICLSTLEHIGLEVYGGQRMDIGDQLAIDNIFASLKSGGKLLLTVPASVSFQITSTWRSYDSNSIKKLLAKYKSVNIRYGIRIDQKWQIVSRIPEKFEFDPHMPSGVALIEAFK
ncbi:MAG: class I SAM-dependent methyltransferase [Candidatus Amesbacteria bacterium]|nr:class I SAM-dependent methyltransferase [Candidatus Amesbacteria bacterium]